MLKVYNFFSREGVEGHFKDFSTQQGMPETTDSILRVKKGSSALGIDYIWRGRGSTLGACTVCPEGIDYTGLCKWLALLYLSLWCVSQHLLILLVDDFDQLKMVICWSRAPLQAMVNVVLLFLALGAGTVSHRHWNCHHCQYNSSVASSRQLFFIVAMQKCNQHKFFIRLRVCRHK